MKITREPAWFKQPSEIPHLQVNVSDKSKRSLNYKLSNDSNDYKIERYGSCTIYGEHLREFVLAMESHKIMVEIQSYVATLDVFIVKLYVKRLLDSKGL